MSNSFFINSNAPVLSENIPDTNMLKKFETKIDDAGYFDFLVKSKYVSFFFDYSIQIYGYNHGRSYNNIDEINILLDKEYGQIFNDLVSFGQDVFGNQFCFETLTKRIVLFNVETGEREQIAQNFIVWIKVLSAEIDYYSGKVLLRKWQSLGNELLSNQRLCPKIPFVAGGVYSEDNLYAGTYPAYLKAYANIARQVFGMKDGIKIQLKIE